MGHHLSTVPRDHEKPGHEKPPPHFYLISNIISITIIFTTVSVTFIIIILIVIKRLSLPVGYVNAGLNMDGDTYINVCEDDIYQNVPEISQTHPHSDHKVAKKPLPTVRETIQVRNEVQLEK